MLKTRVMTALVLLAFLVAVVLSKSPIFFVIAATGFFAAAVWESHRLFGDKRPWLGAALWTALFAFLMFNPGYVNQKIFFGTCVALWVLRFAPSLKFGLPFMQGFPNRLLGLVYALAVLGCFLAIAVLYSWSPLYLLSVMALVWIADIGAYFSGKAFGKHKMAPTISPGKSWEGALGGCLAVLVLAAISVAIPGLADTFAVHVQAKWGWLGLIAVMVLFDGASIVGDLFESQLKRRANRKDSSNLLPGHGGVLDRIDAMLPTLPLAVLLGYWL
ncbi:phosphatidate cytidylyltransferase [Actimicrobium sp. GrIS 1.19]|uniref:phosphatidate cytidylyltransferase n=1 Tax=Actimicrobium sp. GrIS 1.19 TaxID=3071708 RepID=UPI002DFBF0BB|nr:phosphatidate cytidylyltransferase [Actimicrobium sp. GrIS 1.19]